MPLLKLLSKQTKLIEAYEEREAYIQEFIKDIKGFLEAQKHEG